VGRRKGGKEKEKEIRKRRGREGEKKRQYVGDEGGRKREGREGRKGRERESNYVLVSFSPEDKNLMKSQTAASHQKGMRKGRNLPQKLDTSTTGMGEVEL
jgi:hypothetical protein